MARFLNPLGYTLTKIGDDDDGAVYEFRLDRERPLTYVRDNGVCVQPDRRYTTNMGSIPEALHWISGFEKDRFLLSYCFHDCAYRQKSHCLYVSPGEGYPFVSVSLTRRQADTLLYETILHGEGGSALSALIIYVAVRVFGGRAWANAV